MKQLNNDLKLMAMVSHEIRTPLNAILGITDLLRNQKNESTQKKYLEILSETGNNLLELVNNLLDFSKLNSGELSLVKKKFDLRTRITNSLTHNG